MTLSSDIAKTVDSIQAKTSSIATSSSSGENKSSPPPPPTAGQKVALLMVDLAFSVGLYIALKYSIEYYNKRQVASKGKGNVDRLRGIVSKKNSNNKSKNRLANLELNSYEMNIASDVIDPSDIKVRFVDIGGIDAIKAELWELVVFPLLRPDLFISNSGLVSPPLGVLLYGAPGTGKTMLAKAIAAEGSAAFINVRLSSIMDKYFGESNKLISAVFSLAKQLAPSIIFIDELDTFLNQRDGSEGSATSTMKSEFLTLWDGMLSGGTKEKTVIVLGATNRPYDVDSAILRRLPRTFEVGLPDEQSRLQILEVILKKHPLSENAKRLLPFVAKRTVGYSGSDLKELCRCAAMEPIREIMKNASKDAVNNTKQEASPQPLENNLQENKGTQLGPPKGMKIRPISERDFLNALERVRKTGDAAKEFRKKESMSSEASDSGTRMNVQDLARGMQALNHIFSSIPNRQPQQGPPSGSNNTAGGEGKDNSEEKDDIPNLDDDSFDNLAM